MPGKWKTVLAVIIVLASASWAQARCRMVAPGPEWYLDDRGCLHSIRADWAGIQRHARTRRAPIDSGSDADPH
jgi:hypothetical protein